jgi:hypothetical protein
MRGETMRKNYERDDKAFPYDNYYSVRQYRGVAFVVLGWETEPDEDTEWSGYEVRTGRVIAVMVGDDHRHSVEEDDLTVLKRSAFCGGCGQIGCHCDGYEEEESA